MRALTALLVAVLTGCVAHAARAQDVPREARAPEHGGTIHSLGQPRLWKFRAGASVGANFSEADAGAVTYVESSAYYDIAQPAISGLGLVIEGYVGHRGAELDGGLRARIESPFLRLGLGYDQNLHDGDPDFVLSFIHPLRRSGVFGRGTLVRVDWLPWRGHSFNVGVILPLQRNMGSTRARSDHVELSSPSVPSVPGVVPRPELRDALANVSDSAAWINRLTTPNFDQNGGSHRAAMVNFEARVAEIRAHINSTAPFVDGKRTYEADVRAYHRELARAFSIAASDTGLSTGESTPLGHTVAQLARDVLLREVIVPYNRYLGLTKKPDSTHPFAARARGAFVRWLHTASEIPRDRLGDVLHAFSEVLKIVEDTRAWSRRDWGDSRFVWIPYQLALLPEEHDTQEEIDALIEHISREDFTRGNRVWYVVNEQFHVELARTIHETEDYHVLWIHDIRGVNADGDPDALSYKYILLDYLAVLTRNVRRYDQTGTLPVYMIVLDQYFYELNKGRLWMSLLEKPLKHNIRMPHGFEYMEEAIERAQDELREAVLASELLQAEARQYGDGWLQNRIKVHINITNPADPSFFSRQILPFVGVPDNLMRDHRKIAFYDITEEDPYKGMAIYTGMGLGEHYAGATWEDRALMVQGPATLSLKRAALTLLRNQGFEPEEIPFPLLPRDKPDNYDALIEAELSRSHDPLMTGLQVHNQTGYRPKPINGIKATLYTLMPPGSLLKVPDSLWNNPLWAGMLVGGALRGTRTFVIAPSLASAPSSDFPQMARAYELFSRLVVLQRELRAEIEAGGGMLKTGIYNPNVDVGDVVGRTHAVVAGLRSHDFLIELVDLHTHVDSVLASVDEMLEHEGFDVTHLVPGDELGRPKLHLKSQFFASWSAWDRLVGSSELGPMAAEYVRQIAYQVQHRDVGVDVRSQARLLLSLATPAVERAKEQRASTGADDALLYLLAGSQNMDYRGMLYDGEVGFIVSGYGSIVALFDFITLLGLSTWIDTVHDLEGLLPKPSEWQRTVGRAIRTML